MGTNFTRIFGNLFGKQDIRILMIGLDRSGKTTILYKLKLGQIVNTIPTIGFNVQTVEHQRFKMTMWDVGGQDKLRALWRHYYANTNGLIFVVDASDKQRMQTVKYELYKALQEQEIKDTPLLILANKQDIASISLPEMVQYLGLDKLKNKQWYIVGTCGTSGQGLLQGLSWLCKAQKTHKNK